MSKAVRGALLLGLVGCADPGPIGGGRAELIGGTLDSGDPAVVALTTISQGSFCTGTLVSPSVVLTAAHCIDLAGSDETVVFFGADVSSEGTRIGTRTVQRHPGWTGEVGSNGPHQDIGLLLLNFPQDPALPVPFNRTPLGDHVGAPYRVVGFGIYQRDPPSSDGRKRTGLSAIEALQHDVLLTGDSEVSVCFGDSGGPGFITLDDVEYVAGVHSYTFGALSQPPDRRCIPPNGDTRVDLFADDFVQAWIDDNDPVCGRDGTCGYRGCSADPDCEPCGADGNCTAGCDLPDVDCATSALGDLCQADSQCVEGSCVFWQGDPSTKFCTVPCTGPGDACPDGMSCQDVSGLGTLCYYDDDPPGVLGTACTAATDCGSYLCDQGACVTRCDLTVGLRCPADFECRSDDQVDYFCRALAPPDEGGCAVGRRGGGAGVLVLLALAALPAVAYRRRRASAARSSSSR